MNTFDILVFLMKIYFVNFWQKIVFMSHWSKSPCLEPFFKKLAASVSAKEEKLNTDATETWRMGDKAGVFDSCDEP